jgi:hypothetical protein
MLPWKGEDGEDLYLRIGKQFREAPEMLTHPLQKIGGKASPLMQLVGEQVFGSTPGSGFPAEWKRKPHESEFKLRGKAALEKALPFSIRPWVTGQPAPLAGSIPVSKGMSKWSTVEQLVDAIGKGDTAEIESIRKHALENNIDYDLMLKTAKAEVTKIKNYEYRDMALDIVEKIEKSGQPMHDIIQIELEKSGLPMQEWKLVYEQIKKIRKARKDIARQKMRYGVDTHTIHDRWPLQ